MARPKQSFNKKEKEKLRAKKREEKSKKKEERKSNSSKGAGLEDMLVYVDEFGQLTNTPPDPSKKVEIALEDIVIGIAKRTEEEEQEEAAKTGKVTFFDTSKGFGFILDLKSQEKYFFHVSQLIDQVEENDKVTFELEKGQRGLNAVRVQKI